MDRLRLGTACCKLLHPSIIGSNAHSIRRATCHSDWQRLASLNMASTPLASAEIETLRNRARQAAEHSYSPYSRFRVGAALLLTNGAIVTGCNVENCSYRLTCCAEQSAIARAVAEHGPGIRLRAVAIANLNAATSMPCGACRQTLAEFGDDSTLILYPGENSIVAETTLGALLPAAFRLKHLETK